MMSCEHEVSDVRDSRPYIFHGNAVIKRRRECCKCHVKFTTFELTVEKMANALSIKIQNNIKDALEIACKKIYAESLQEALVESFEAKIVRQGTAIVRYLDKPGPKVKAK